MRAPAVLLSLALLVTGVVAQAPNRYQFLRAFDVAREAGDQAGMEAAVRASPDHAMEHFKALCRDRRVQHDDADLLAALTAMKRAWAGVHGSSKAMESVEQFILGLGEEVAAGLPDAERELQACLVEVNRAERAGSRANMLAASERTEKVAQLLESLGDLEHAAEAWGAVARIVSLIPDRLPHEQARMVDALQSFVHLRESWGWMHDPAYAHNVAFLAAQTSAADPGVAVDEEPYFDTLVTGEEVVAALEFEVFDKLESDMFVHGGPVPTLWASVAHTGDGPARMPYFKRGDLFLVRQAAQRFGVTTDAAASNVTPVAASQRPKPSLFHLDADRSQPYAMWFFVGGTEERYMETDLNLLPYRELAILFFRSAASWKTTLAGERVVFFDDNADGRLFIADPDALGVRVRTLGKVEDPGTAVPAYDSMRVGRGPRIPYSEVVQIQRRWYRLRGIDDGTAVGIQPLDPELHRTGVVELDWTGNRRAAPELLIIRGRGAIASTAFDISSGDPVEVPAGDYEISFGRIVVGSGSRIRTAKIFKGESEPFTVAEGETVSLEMGAPFRLEFEREGAGPEIAIDAAKIRVLDNRGAQYAMLHGAVVAPDVMASSNPDGRGAAVVGGFTPVDDTDLALLFAERSPLLKYSAIAFPRPKQAQGQAGDLVFRLRLPSAGMVVGLQQDRHPLFGRLEPVFK